MPVAPPSEKPGLVELALKRIGQVFCRHQFRVLEHRDGRKFLLCADCGQETHGFLIERKADRPQRSP